MTRILARAAIFGRDRLASLVVWAAAGCCSCSTYTVRDEYFDPLGPRDHTSAFENHLKMPVLRATTDDCEMQLFIPKHTRFMTWGPIFLPVLPWVLQGGDQKEIVLQLELQIDMEAAGDFSIAAVPLVVTRAGVPLVASEVILSAHGWEREQSTPQPSDAADSLSASTYLSPTRVRLELDGVRGRVDLARVLRAQGYSGQGDFTDFDVTLTYRFPTEHGAPVGLTLWLDDLLFVDGQPVVEGVLKLERVGVSSYDFLIRI